MSDPPSRRERDRQASGSSSSEEHQQQQQQQQPDAAVRTGSPPAGDLTANSERRRRSSEERTNGQALGVLPSMAYCHACDLAIRPLVSPSEAYSCPRCGGDFVELLDERDPEQAHLLNLGAGGGGAGAGVLADDEVPLPTLPSLPPEIGFRRPPPPSAAARADPRASARDEPRLIPPYDPQLSPALNLINALLGGLGGATIGGAAHLGGTTGGVGARIDPPRSGGGSGAAGGAQGARTALPPAAARGSIRGGSARLGPVNVQWRLSSNAGGGSPHAAANAHRGPSASDAQPRAADMAGTRSAGSLGGGGGGGSSDAGTASGTGTPGSSAGGGRRRANSDTRAAPPASEWRPLAGGPAGVEARGNGAADVPSLSSFLNAAFGPRPDLTAANAQAARAGTRQDAPFDDGMGGVGAASDGRYFNHDNDGPPDEREGERTGRAPTGGEFGPLVDLFTDFFGGMVGGGGGARGGVAAAGGGPGGLLFNLFGGGGVVRGNPGDYAWGEQGLDNIITQLMEQAQAAGAGSTAPPPAPDDAIAALERFDRHDAQRLAKARNDDCPTCKEEFAPASAAADEHQAATDPPERVAGDADDGAQQDTLVAMPCNHTFHEDCLVPWLKMHGTCPVCRITLGVKQQQQQQAQASTSAASSSSHEEDLSTRMPGALPGSNPPTDETPATPAQMRQVLRSAAERRAHGDAHPPQDELD